MTKTDTTAEFIARETPLQAAAIAAMIADAGLNPADYHVHRVARHVATWINDSILDGTADNLPDWETVWEMLAGGYDDACWPGEEAADAAWRIAGTDWMVAA